MLTLPFDVVKTQRQIELGNSEVHPGELAGLRVGAWGGNQDSPVVRGHPRTLTRSSLPAVAASKSSSTWLLMRRIRAESGTRGLFAGKDVPLGWGLPVPWCHRGANRVVLAGFLPRVIKVAPACAIMISTYEFGKTFFQKLNQERRLRGL